MKYSLSTREIPRAELKEFHEGVGYNSPYILTRVILQTLSMSKHYNSGIVLWECNIERIDSLYSPGSWGFIFLYRPSSTG